MKGKLVKNEDGRFEFDGCVLHSGDVVELKISDKWCCGRVEYSDGYYFIYGEEMGKTLIPSIGMDARSVEKERL